MRQLPVVEAELSERIRRNRKRLEEPYYGIDEVFCDTDGWPGDKVGRALLAFVSHAAIDGYENPCMKALVAEYPRHRNEQGFLGKDMAPVLWEQSFSGHSWLLRGLCAYYEQYGDPAVLAYARDIVEGLYLPAAGRISSYPVERPSMEEGGVSGHSGMEWQGWLLSTDVGCAFMSVDGLSHYYVLTEDPRVFALLREMTEVYCAIDKEALRAQTHCTLTAARGMVRLYEKTGDSAWRKKAEEILDLYVKSGMTLTYENYNWWGRADTWTEPCAVVDSLMLALSLYKITGNSERRTLAARIFHNGFASIQRDNGGAGTNTIVTPDQPVLHALMYEAPFCCTMRLAEGLRFICENKELLYAETEGVIRKDAFGRYRDGDILYARTVAEDGTEGDLHPLLPYYCMTNEAIGNTRQKVVFG